MLNLNGFNMNQMDSPASAGAMAGKPFPFHKAWWNMRVIRAGHNTAHAH